MSVQWICEKLFPLNKEVHKLLRFKEHWSLCSLPPLIFIILSINEYRKMEYNSIIKTSLTKLEFLPNSPAVGISFIRMNLLRQDVLFLSSNSGSF